MAQMNGMHGSETLNNEIFQKGPKVPELQAKIDAMLLQFSPEAKKSPKVQEALNRIGSISDTIASVAEGTRADLVELYKNTVVETHLSDYSSKVAILESHQRNRVASVLGASNDENYTQAA